MRIDKENVFMFPGQGADYQMMGYALMQHQPEFRKSIAACNALILEMTGINVLDHYHSRSIKMHEFSWEKRILVSLGGTLAVEYGLYQLLLSVDIIPNAVVGYSMGEIAASIASNIFTLTEAVQLIVAVAKASGDLNTGAMIAVKMPMQKISIYKNTGASVVSMNSPDVLVWGGSDAAMQSLKKLLIADNYFYKDLNIPCAYHTSEVGILNQRLVSVLSNFHFRKPTIPVFRSGIAAADYESSPLTYWIEFFSSPMNLWQCILACDTNFQNAQWIEVGPSSGMAGIVKKITQRELAVFSLLSTQGENENAHFLKTIHAMRSVAENKVVMTENNCDDNDRIVLLTDIFSKVLEFPVTDIHADFFKMGGDSLMQLHCLSLMNQYGFPVSPEYFENNANIAALAKVKTGSYEKVSNNPVMPSVPLTPLQNRFFKKPYRWQRQTLTPFVLFCDHVLNATILQKACQAFVNRHDVFQMRYTLHETQWVQSVGAVPAIDLKVFDFENSISHTVDISSVINESQKHYDFLSGVYIQFLLVRCKDKSIFVTLCHHLCIDGYSFQLLAKEISFFYRAFQKKSVIHLSKPATSFQSWAMTINALSYPLTIDDVMFWRNQSDRFTERMQIDPLLSMHNLSSSVVELSVSLSSVETVDLIQKGEGVGVLEMLLFACAKAFSKQFACSQLFVDLRSHGRNTLDDLSDTVGWLTTVFPFLIELTDDDLTGEIKKIHAQLKAIPENGVTYNILRYLCRDKAIQEMMAQLQSPEIAFNYHGRLDGLSNLIQPFYLKDYHLSNNKNVSVSRSHLLNIDAWILHQQLTITLTFSKHLFKEDVILRYLDAIKSLLLSMPG